MCTEAAVENVSGDSPSRRALAGIYFFATVLQHALNSRQAASCLLLLLTFKAITSVLASSSSYRLNKLDA